MINYRKSMQLGIMLSIGSLLLVTSQSAYLGLNLVKAQRADPYHSQLIHLHMVSPIRTGQANGPPG
ncbi:MAG TPA: hypothetical protein VJ729_15325 [Nitrososphaeraceae archaeon]|nr:hypothetical protein [Nitrososphaeraceae archaeon]